MYDRALNFLLFKVVFVGAILEPRWEELLIWTAWFTILGFLRVFSMLCRDRFEYVSPIDHSLCFHLCFLYINIHQQHQVGQKRKKKVKKQSVYESNPIMVILTDDI